MGAILRPKLLILLALILFLLLLSLRASESQHSAYKEARTKKLGQRRTRSRRFKSPPELIEDLRESKRFLEAHFREFGHKIKFYKKSQKGIVISAGGRRLLVNAFITIKGIREYFKSQLPIELYYYGESEVDTKVFQAIEDLNVRVIDASLLPRPDWAEWPEKLHDYTKKIFSLYSTGFTEVLMLDADNQLLTHPDRLFGLQEYQENGALFWPDYWTAGASLEAPKEAIYRFLDIPNPWDISPNWASTESGQFLFNREVHSSALDWILWLNIWSRVIYDYVLGDKDTFEIGFMLSGNHDKFVRISTPPRAAFSQVQDGSMKHVGMVQSINGQPSFLHRTSGGKFDDSKLLKSQPRPEFITEPMSVSRAKQYIWHAKWAINVLPQQFSIFEPECEYINPVTIKALCKITDDPNEWDKYRKGSFKKAQGYCQCEKNDGGANSGLVPLLPVPVYGQIMFKAIEASFEAFEEIKILLE